MRTWNAINYNISYGQWGIYLPPSFSPQFNPTVWTLRQNANFPLQEPRTFTPLIFKEN